MPRICIEWVPVQRFGLGLLGFDHLQLVFQSGDAEPPARQDDWYVMEGVREEAAYGPYLGIEGANGRTTLAVANLAARDDLIAKIGTPEYRGSRVLPYAGDEFRAWETMASYARNIEDQDFPYIAYGLPGSPTPTINSSSAIASLVYYSGLDPSLRMPFGMHLSPGTTTLLGTSGDDAMRMERGFTTLVGGEGRDAFAGGIDAEQIEKFYGGSGDDLFHWSTGFNIVHGGQPLMSYAADGTDVMDYSGAGTVTITFNRHWIPHKVPNYVAVLKDGLDHLFSIERIQWNETSDHIVLGAGVDLLEDDIILDPASHHRSGRLVDPDAEVTPVRCYEDCALPEGARHLELAGEAVGGFGNETDNRLIGNDGDNVMRGFAGDDTLYGGAGNDTLDGGEGSDGYVYLPGDGDDVVIDAGGSGTDALILAGGFTPEDVSLYRLLHAPGDLLLAVAGGGSILLKGFFDSGSSSIDRVVFDRAPAWTRDQLQVLAAEAPLIDGRELAHADDRLVFQAELASGHQAPLGTAALGNAAAVMHRVAEHIPPDAATTSTEPDFDLLEGWLF